MANSQSLSFFIAGWFENPNDVRKTDSALFCSKTLTGTQKLPGRWLTPRIHNHRRTRSHTEPTDVHSPKFRHFSANKSAGRTPFPTAKHLIATAMLERKELAFRTSTRVVKEHSMFRRSYLFLPRVLFSHS